MTLFNFLNFAIAVCLLFVGAYSNLAFLAIIIVNMSIGIFQEIHARNLVQNYLLWQRKCSCCSKWRTTRN